jgi:hypothetical protein
MRKSWWKCGLIYTCNDSDSSVIVTSVIALQGYMFRCKILVVDAWHPGRVHVDFKCWVCIIYGSHLLLVRALVSALVFRRMTTGDRLAHHHQFSCIIWARQHLRPWRIRLAEAMLHVGYAFWTQLTFYSLA